MDKSGMRRPDPGKHDKNEVAPVPELQGAAKRSKQKAKPVTEPQ